MPFTVTVERLPTHVRFNVSGPASLKNYFDLIEDAGRESLTHGDMLAVVDIRAVAGRLHFKDQFFIGELAAGKLAHLRKVATLVPQDPASYNSPKVASKLGLQMRSFADEQQALAWLLGG